MNISHNKLKKSIITFILSGFIANPVLALDFDTVDNSTVRKNYSASTVKKEPQTPASQQVIKQTTTSSNTTIQNSNTQILKQVQEKVVTTQKEVQTIQEYEKLPNVPKLPEKAFSKSVAPINTMYTGKVPDNNAITICNDIKIGELILDDKYKDNKTKLVNIITPKQSSKKTNTHITTKYRYRILPKGMQFRVVNLTKINDYMSEGQKITFKTTQSVKTPYFNIPAGTIFTGMIDDIHRPQITCNGGLISIKMISAQINGYNQSIDGSIVKMKTDKIRLSNIKGEHTYFKTTCKKAKWGQNKFKKYAKTSSKLADKGAGVLLAPFPYLSGCILSAASTITSPLTALTGKGKSIAVAPNTTFTIKLNKDAKIRY